MLFFPRLQEFGKPLDAVLRVCIQMTLIPIFVRRSCARPMKTGKPNKHIDLEGISRRFQEFSDASRSKPYQRQKTALERQLADSLASLSPPKCVSSCTSDDIIKFLISRVKSAEL